MTHTFQPSSLPGSFASSFFNSCRFSSINSPETTITCLLHCRRQHTRPSTKHKLIIRSVGKLACTALPLHSSKQFYCALIGLCVDPSRIMKTLSTAGMCSTTLFSVALMDILPELLTYLLTYIKYS